MNETSPEDWPVTRSELVGRYRQAKKVNLSIVAIVMGLAFICTAALLIYLFVRFDGMGGYLPRFLLIFTLPYLVFAIVFAVWWPRRSRWEALAPKIWDADGCICPWCKINVREEACEAHGVDVSHRDLLVAYYASPMLDNTGTALQQLVSAVPRPPRRTWLSVGPIGWVIRQTQTIRNKESDPASRKAAIINLSLAWYGLLASTMVVVAMVVPKGISYLFGSGFSGWMLLIMPLFFIWSPLSIGAPKCKACRQQCHAMDQVTCSECGADLRKPGAITRKEWNTQKALKIAPVFIGLYAFPFIMAFIVGQLPAPARHVIWGTIGAPTGHFMNLDIGTMTKARAEEEADLTLHLARPNGPGIKFNFDSNFIATALEAGLIPESYREDAARTTVSASILLEDTADDQEIVLVPRIDRSLLGTKGPRLAFGGISIDGGPWSPGASWTLIHEDLDEWWRANSSSREPRPESQLTFRTPVDLEPGPHEIRARCWIVIHGYDWNPLDLAFDPDGNPDFPTKAKVYDLSISTTVEVR